MTCSQRAARLASPCLALVLAACGESVRQNDSAAGRGGTTALGGGGAPGTGGVAASGGSGAAGRVSNGGGGWSSGGRSGNGAGGADSGRGGAVGTAGGTENGAGLGGHDALAGAGGAAPGGREGDAGQGGAPQSGQSQGGAAGAGAGGLAAAGVGGDGRCRSSDPPQTCTAIAVPPDTTIVDFERYAPDGTWSSAVASGISGTTSLYHDAGGSDLVLTPENGSLHVTGTIPAGFKRAGWIFDFDSCIDGSNNLGLTLIIDGSLGGPLGGIRLTAAVETNADYPVDVNRGKGACTFINCETRTPQCAFPFASVVPQQNSGLSYLLWSDFNNGAPESSVSPASAMQGLKFDVQCGQDITDCSVDFWLGIVKFFHG